MQQVQRLEIHADVGTELDATLHAASTAQGFGEKIEVRRQQRVTLVALNVLGAKIAGPEGLLLCLEAHGVDS